MPTLMPTLIPTLMQTLMPTGVERKAVAKIVPYITSVPLARITSVTPSVSDLHAIALLLPRHLSRRPSRPLTPLPTINPVSLLLTNHAIEPFARHHHANIVSEPRLTCM